LSKKSQIRLIADEKDGFSKNPHLLTEALILADITISQLRICLYLLRRTLGWSQKEAAISLRDFAYVCKSDRSYASKQVKDLVKKNILIITGIQDRKHVYRMNFDISSWDVSCINIDRLINIPKGGPHNNKKAKIADHNYTKTEDSFSADQMLYSDTTSSISKTAMLHSAATSMWYADTTSMLYSDTTFEPASPLEESEEETGLNKLLKKDKYKIIRAIYFERSYYYQLAKLLADLITERNRRLEEPDIQVWAMAIDYMINSDERHPEEIKEIILYSQQDEFWKTIVTDTEKLRFFYDNIKTKRLLKNGSRYKKDKEYDKYEIIYIS
jgi:phage replication O-like protein O